MAAGTRDGDKMDNIVTSQTMEPPSQDQAPTLSILTPPTATLIAPSQDQAPILSILTPPTATLIAQNPAQITLQYPSGDPLSVQDLAALQRTIMEQMEKTNKMMLEGAAQQKELQKLLTNITGLTTTAGSSSAENTTLTNVPPSSDAEPQSDVVDEPSDCANASEPLINVGDSHEDKYTPDVDTIKEEDIQLSIVVEDGPPQPELLTEMVDRSFNRSRPQTIRSMIGGTFCAVPQPQQCVTAVGTSSAVSSQLPLPTVVQKRLPDAAPVGVKSTKSILSKLIKSRSHNPCLPQQGSAVAAVPLPQALFINQTALSEQFCLTGNQVVLPNSLLYGGRTLLIAEPITAQQQQQQSLSQQQMKTVPRRDKLQPVLKSSSYDVVPPRATTSKDQPKLKETMSMKELVDFVRDFKNQRETLGLSISYVARATNIDRPTMLSFEDMNLDFEDMCKLKRKLCEWMNKFKCTLRKDSSSKDRTLSNDATVLSIGDSNDVSLATNDLSYSSAVTFDSSVEEALEAVFPLNTCPSTAEIAAYADMLEVDGKAIRTWFNNRRIKQKLKKGSKSMAARLCEMNEGELDEFLFNPDPDSDSMANKILTMNEHELHKYIAETSAALQETAT